MRLHLEVDVQCSEKKSLIAELEIGLKFVEKRYSAELKYPTELS